MLGRPESSSSQGGGRLGRPRSHEKEERDETSHHRGRCLARPHDSNRARVAWLPALILATAASATATDDYVDINHTGGTLVGDSWTNPLHDLDTALTAATSSDRIFVAVGTYTVAIGSGRSKTFNVPNGVKLYGGFTNGDPIPPMAYSNRFRETVLTGDINVGGNPLADA